MEQRKFSAARVFVQVTLASLAGMLLGGLFGWGAAALAPGLFAKFFPWEIVEPTGVAVVLGAFGGTLCGGALGAFAQGVELLASWRAQSPPANIAPAAAAAPSATDRPAS